MPFSSRRAVLKVPIRELTNRRLLSRRRRLYSGNPTAHVQKRVVQDWASFRGRRRRQRGCFQVVVRVSRLRFFFFFNFFNLFIYYIIIAKWKVKKSKYTNTLYINEKVIKPNEKLHIIWIRNNNINKKRGMGWSQKGLEHKISIFGSLTLFKLWLGK